MKFCLNRKKLKCCSVNTQMKKKYCLFFYEIIAQWSKNLNNLT